MAADYQHEHAWRLLRHACEEIRAVCGDERDEYKELLDLCSSLEDELDDLAKDGGADKKDDKPEGVSKDDKDSNEDDETPREEQPKSTREAATEVKRRLRTARAARR